MKEETAQNNIPQERCFQFIKPNLVKLIFGLALILGFFTLSYLFLNKKPEEPLNDHPEEHVDRIVGGEFEMKNFNSVEEFEDYLSRQPVSGGYYGGMMELNGALLVEDMVDAVVVPSVARGTLEKGVGESVVPKRVSETNVQVSGIDEPDMVKVDDKSLFVSILNRHYRGTISSGIADITDNIYGFKKSETKILQAFPPEEMEQLGGINNVGDLLLSGDNLVVFTSDIIHGYDVSDRSSPKKIWEIPYDDRTNYVAARLYGDEIFLILNTRVNMENPCPYYPVKIGGEGLSIDCTDIYYPTIPVSTNTTYTVMKINISDGTVKEKVSFLGDSVSSVVYMSKDNIYLTYSYYEDRVNMVVKFIREEGATLFSEFVKDKIVKLSSYDISSRAKNEELNAIMEDYFSNVSVDEQMRIENEFENAFARFEENHIREFTTTGIVKIGVNNLDITSTGKVPGHPLNQFSLDEYKGNLRIATNSSSYGFSSSGDVNDVYVLDGKLKIIGNVLDLGKDERIYSTRFLGDRGYVVTFRETDPFYVLDLSDPNNPQMKGELKIPGYSSYLHPVSGNLILGVGREDANVKLSLFDVSNASDPVEKDKYLLKDYWDKVSQNHHAFLMDPDHKVFFIPGSEGGYIVSYEGDKLRLIRTVKDTNIERAIYIDDYMYIIGKEGITVLNEKDWEEVKDFRF
jgi:uncharacterized secreted protein with C-terminal beta-propeller domain